MQTLVSIQQWLYQNMGQSLGEVAGGNTRAVAIAMAAAVLLGAVHALMPGHGKIVLVSYHLGQRSNLLGAFLNGAILALTHVGLAAALVLAGYSIISRAFAYGGRTTQFETASGAFILMIGAYLLWAALTHRHSLRQGKTLALATGMIPCPLTTFVLSYALARGVLASGLVVTVAMALGMIVTIGGLALIAAFARERLAGVLARSAGWRERAGKALEVGGALLVFLLGAATLVGSLRT